MITPGDSSNGSTRRRSPSKLGSVCEGLLLKIFWQPIDTSDAGVAIAFTSAHPSAGVTEVVSMLATSLRRGGEPLATSMGYRSLIHMGVAPVNSLADQAGLNAGRPNGESNETEWHAVQAALTNSLERLRRRYRYVLVDCAPMNEAQDAMRIAPLVDGVVLVVEANRTRREQILYAERNIESVNGRILGHVLNKRTYAIPAWFHRVMTAAGM
jgi:hypothetical protein